MIKRPRKMRLTEAHIALLPTKIDDPGPTPQQGRLHQPSTTRRRQCRTRSRAAGRRSLAFRLRIFDLEQEIPVRGRTHWYDPGMAALACARIWTRRAAALLCPGTSVPSSLAA